MTIERISGPPSTAIVETVHRLLAYIRAVGEKGYRIHRTELEVYAAEPQRRQGRVRYAGTTIANALVTVGRALDAIGATPVPDEHVVDWLQRMRWVRIDPDERLHLTQLGEALLRHLDDQLAGVEVASAIVLDPDDPLAYARIVGRIAQLKDALLVDPYVRAEDVFLLSREARVTRILTRRGPERTVEIAATLTLLQLDRRPEVRLSGELHDRFASGSDGTLLSFGASLNGVGRSVTVIQELGSDVSSAVRAELERLWNQAEHLELPGAPDHGAPTARRQLSAGADGGRRPTARRRSRSGRRPNVST